MNQEQKQRLRTLWLTGVKAEAIAAELGVSYQTLRKNRQRLGLQSRLPTYHFHPVGVSLLSAAETIKAYHLWRSGKDTKNIASAIHPNGGEAAVYNSVSNYRERLRKGET